MKKTVITLTLIAALLFSAVAGAQFVNLGKANPFYDGGWASPPEGTEPPIILVFSPENNTVFASNNLSISFNVSVSKDTYKLTDIYYDVDWKEGNTSVYHLDTTSYSYNWITQVPYIKNFVGIPEGSHSINIIAAAQGQYVVEERTGYHFEISCSSSIYFTIDNTAPKVTVSSIENKTYTASNLPLTLTVNEPVSKISYVLDRLANATVLGNTTLTGLANGVHDLTIYAWDEAGNVGTSETVSFAVDVPFPTVPVAFASGVSAIAIAAGLLIYFKKRKH